MQVQTKPRIAGSDIDYLGALLAQISELTEIADEIKTTLKKSGLLELEGQLFRATVSTSERTSYDPRKVELLLGDQISLVEKVTKSVSVRVVSR